MRLASARCFCFLCPLFRGSLMTATRLHLAVAAFRAWLLGTRRTVAPSRALILRNALSVLLLFTACLDFGSPWIATAIANNETCSCCHRKGAACCRRMRHGAGWQDRSECGSNCSCARGTNFSAAPWASEASAQLALVPAGFLRIAVHRDSATAPFEFSLRQRPPPFSVS
jgi:hypothetical protein